VLVVSLVVLQEAPRVLMMEQASIKCFRCHGFVFHLNSYIYPRQLISVPFTILHPHIALITSSLHTRFVLV